MSSFEDMMLRRLRGEPTPSRAETIKRDLTNQGCAFFLSNEWDDGLVGTTLDSKPIYEFRKLVEIRMKAIGATGDMLDSCTEFVNTMLAQMDPNKSKIFCVILYGQMR